MTSHAVFERSRLVSKTMPFVFETSHVVFETSRAVFERNRLVSKTIEPPAKRDPIHSPCRPLGAGFSAEAASE